MHRTCMHACTDNARNSETNKKSVTERCPRLLGNRVYIKIAELFDVY